MQVNMLEAKTQLSKLVEAALRGEEVVIANRGKPVVKLVKAEAPVKRKWGAWAGLMTDEQIEHAFSPEVEADMAREWIASLDRPIEAGSLHEGQLDMVVYYVPVDGGLLEVTATFAPKTGGDPLRIVMGLADSDSVAFSMPGHEDSLYAFSRSGEEVTASSGTEVHPRAER